MLTPMRRICIAGRSRLEQRPNTVCLGLILFALVPASEPAVAQRRPLPRAERPRWNERDCSDVFFDNAFREGLHGQRPQPARESEPTELAPSTSPEQARAWSTIVSARTLEDEVKRSTTEIRDLAQRKSQITGQAAVATAHRLRHLAAVFGVISSYEGEVRWKDVAPHMARNLASWSDSVARGDVAALAESTWVLNDLVHGNVSSDKSEMAVPLASLVSRTAVMDRLQRAVESELRSALANERLFGVKGAPRLTKPK